MEHHDQKGRRRLERVAFHLDAPCHPHDLIEIRRRGCVLLVLLMTAGCDTSPGPPRVLETTVISSPAGGVPIAPEPVTRVSYGTEVFSERIGSFVVVEEKAEPWLRHMPSGWIHLSFDTPDRRVNVTVTDDGAKLYASAQSSACSSTVHPLQYEGSEDESDLFAGMVASLELLVKSCGARMQGAARYPELLEVAEPGFPEAVRAMKGRVVQAFGRRMERCRLPDPDEASQPNDPCY